MQELQVRDLKRSMATIGCEVATQFVKSSRIFGCRTAV